MFKITIERKYKYKYTVFRNRRAVCSFYNKKLARDKLYELKRDFENLSKSQSFYRFYPMPLRSGDSLVVYISKRQTFDNLEPVEFKDYYEIQREFNE